MEEEVDMDVEIQNGKWVIQLMFNTLISFPKGHIATKQNEFCLE